MALIRVNKGGESFDITSALYGAFSDHAYTISASVGDKFLVSFWSPVAFTLSVTGAEVLSSASDSNDGAASYYIKATGTSITFTDTSSSTRDIGVVKCTVA